MREKVAADLEYYTENGKLLQDELIRIATLSLEKGEIDFLEYVISIENALTIKLAYIQNINYLNELTLEYNYIVN